MLGLTTAVSCAPFTNVGDKGDGIEGDCDAVVDECEREVRDDDDFGFLDFAGGAEVAVDSAVTKDSEMELAESTGMGLNCACSGDGDATRAAYACD